MNKRVPSIAIALIAILALLKCGKKQDDDTSTPPVVVGKLSVTCGGLSCIGTEAK